MAVLRKQRKLLQALRELEVEELKTDQERWGVDDKLVEAASLVKGGYHYVYENNLILHLIGEEHFSKEKAAEFHDWKKYLNVCIDGKTKLVDTIDNRSYGSKIIKLHLTHEEIMSKRMVQVNSDEGMEILDPLHYWLVHIPRTFPGPSRIVITLTTAVITSIITALIAIESLT